MPGYQATVRPFSNESLNIVYVEYDMPGPSRMPFSAAPDKNGYLWIPNFGAANKITRLDPKTGEMQDFPVANIGTAAIHSAVPAPDGSVWLAEQASNKVGRWDPDTQQITEYHDDGKGLKHTIRIDRSGNVWSTGSPLSKFDPETKKFTRFEEVKDSYDVRQDKNGDIWFTRLFGSKIGKIDEKTMKVTQWDSPTPGGGPRRMEIASDGIVWFDEFNAGKMASFDPKTQAFQEYPLPGPDPTPYALGFDADGYLWYNSHDMDVIGRFDPKTGKTIEYPFPHAEVFMREFFRDAEGRMWYGTNPNNKVGYFYLTKGTEGNESASK
jgi:virginiamycin B lyase